MLRRLWSWMRGSRRLIRGLGEFFFFGCFDWCGTGVGGDGMETWRIGGWIDGITSRLGESLV